MGGRLYSLATVIRMWPYRPCSTVQYGVLEIRRYRNKSDITLIDFAYVKPTPRPTLVGPAIFFLLIVNFLKIS